MTPSRNQGRAIVALILNIANVATVAYSVASFFFGLGFGNMMVIGTSCFNYFTIDSNILSALMSIIIIPFIIMNMATNNRGTSQLPIVCKFIGTVASTLTMITVVVFLGPTQGYAIMFEGPCIFLHLLSPLFALLSFIFFENDNKISFKYSWLGLLPTVLYSIVYIIMVLVLTPANGGWIDFYGFNMGGFWYISLPAMYIATYAICALIAVLRNAVNTSYIKHNNF